MLKIWFLILHMQEYMPCMIKVMEEIYRAVTATILFRIFLLSVVVTIFVWYLVIEVVQKTKVEASDQTAMDLRQLHLIGSDRFP